MEAKLVVAKGKTSVKEIPLGGVSTIIGRRNDCTLRIPSPLVSRQHCELTRVGGRFVVKDLGSSNGTFVNGSKVKQKELKSGDTLGVGPITFIVQLGGAPISPADTARPQVAATVEPDDDFVVAEAVADDAADFVVGDADAADAAEADFVVAEQVSETAAEEADEFVVAEEEPATQVGDVADFVVAEEADESVKVPDGETIHDVSVAEVVADDAESESAEPAEPNPPKKKGLLGRLFGKKGKKTEPAAAPVDEPAAKKPAAEKPPAEKPAAAAAPAAKPAKPAATPAAPAAPAAAAAADDEMPEFFASDDSAQTEETKPVGEEELADFLMGLNEKEE